MKLRRFVPTLHAVNTGLSLLVLLLGLYIIIMPFLPLLIDRVKVGSSPQPLVQQHLQAGRGREAEPQAMPAQNTLVIPKLDMQEVVAEGKTAAALKQGVWRRPHTSTPDQGSNTVLVGHRFTYTNPRGVFYSLDKVAVNDEIVIYWQQNKYVYKVSSTFVVKPSAVEIEAPTDEALLTLYTCTPLWSGRDRLVVQALLQEGRP